MNKSGKWQYSKIKWSLPEENNEGEILDSSSGMVLAQSIEGLVVLKDFDEGFGQKWTVGKKNKDGWFVITNIDSNQVLTADGIETTKVAGLRFFPLLFCLFLI